jgi:hypothetical protein
VCPAWDQSVPDRNKLSMTTTTDAGISRRTARAGLRGEGKGVHGVDCSDLSPAVQVAAETALERQINGSSPPDSLGGFNVYTCGSTKSSIPAQSLNL